MTIPPSPEETERFREAIATRTGLRFEDAKLGFLGDLLAQRLVALRTSCADYLARLERDPWPTELAVLAPDLTVAETYFFRNIDQFRALESIVAERGRAQAAPKRMTVLSAGCATGEEAYSLAILLNEHVPDPAWSLSVVAVDINPVALEKARRAVFSPWSLRETPAGLRAAWFRENGRDVTLSRTARASIAFTERNLSQADPELWRPGIYDVIFCRNVLMYFEPAVAHALVGRIARALAPGGYLFLGHAETLRGLSRDFHLCHTHGTFYYRRKDQLAPERRWEADAASATHVELPAPETTWVEAIRRATERVQELTASPPPPTAMPTRSPRAAQWDIALPLELLRSERFADALALLQAMPEESSGDRDVLLLHAVLLVHGGRPDEAESACLRLLALDELNAGAHYVLALCRESAGDAHSALEHDQTAAYLDPGFAMPRLHLGLLARRRGDLGGARREFERALPLLECEDASRLLLFGGGFGRAALVALCRAELRTSAVGA